MISERQKVIVLEWAVVGAGGGGGGASRAPNGRCAAPSVAPARVLLLQKLEAATGLSSTSRQPRRHIEYPRVLCARGESVTLRVLCTKSHVYGLQQDTLRSVMFAFVMRLLNVSALLLTPVAAYITPPRANDGLVAAAHDEQARQRAEEPEI